MLLGRQLAKRLSALNACIPREAYMMLGSSVDTLEQIVGFDLVESRPLQTPHKVHYMLMVEVRKFHERSCSEASCLSLLEDFRAQNNGVPYISSQDYELLMPRLSNCKGAIGSGSGVVAGGAGPIWGQNALVGVVSVCVRVVPREFLGE